MRRNSRRSTIVTRFRIGIMGTHAAIDYTRTIRLGVQNTLEDAGHTMVIVSDLMPYFTHADAEEHLRVACEIAMRTDLDAVIVPAGCLAVHLSGDNAKALDIVRGLDPARTVVMERNIPGYRCVNKDNLPGMRQCMKHLIETCGFTKIAFISGSASSQGSRERESVYFEEMTAHGLDTPDSLFARGTFTGGCPEVIEKILEDNPDVEAIACATDMIAYDAYDVMRKHGLVVGEDIAITGFDDYPRSANQDPPLSTVHMTGYDLGAAAAREAIRLCEGAEQRERIVSSTFIARSSCGEGFRGGVEHLRMLLRQDPFPQDEFVSLLLSSTLPMAGRCMAEDFRARLDAFFSKVRAAYVWHRRHPSADDLLFSSQDLSMLFHGDYSQHLSLEGFHTVAINLLEALLQESPQEDASWVIGQISHLHLRLSRLLINAQQSTILTMDKREWYTFHMADDALRKDDDRAVAHELLLGEFAHLGVNEADLFLLPEPVVSFGARGVALSDALQPVGRYSRGTVQVATDEAPILLQDLLAKTLPRYGTVDVCTISGIMAGNELLGVAVLDGGSLSDNGQMMAFLNLGFAFKHLQMIANDREMNRLLNQNNLLLEHESQHDELTGLLNRRGFANRLQGMLPTCLGRTAAILYFDLDGLKTINDTLGHDTGDEVIRATADVLRQVLNTGEPLCRLGGDEFVAYLVLDESRSIATVMAGVQRAANAFNESHDVAYRMSISVGSVEFAVDAQTHERIPDLMAQADTRLYEMKRRRKSSRRYAGDARQ